MSYSKHNDEIQNTVHTKPNLSYAAIIAEAIICSPDRKLTLREIYISINTRYPFYSLDKSGWQNSIRHNLSLNKAFYKLPKTTNSSSSVSKGSFWCIRPQDAYAILNKTRRTYPQHRMSIFDIQQDYKFNPSSFQDIHKIKEVNSLQDINKKEFGSFNRIDVQKEEKNSRMDFMPKNHTRTYIEEEDPEDTFFSERFDHY